MLHLRHSARIVIVMAGLLAGGYEGAGALARDVRISPDARRRPSVEQAVPIRMINGLETMRVDESRIAIYRGSAADNAARALIQVEDTITLDIRKIGPGGRDNMATEADRADSSVRLITSSRIPGGIAAAQADGVSADGRPVSGWYMPVLIDDPNDQEPPTGILTRQLSSMRTGSPKHALVDPRFALRRSLPSAFYYDAESGFRPMICYGHPQPFCLWSHHRRKEADFTIFSGELDRGSHEIDAQAFVPPTGRILRMALVLENRGKVAASVGVKPAAAAGAAVPAAIVAPGASIVVAEVSTATTSTRRFVLETTNPIVVRVHALGFSILQPH